MLQILDKQKHEALMARHLSTMATFYAANNKFMMSEGLFRQAIDSISKQKSCLPSLSLDI